MDIVIGGGLLGAGGRRKRKNQTGEDGEGLSPARQERKESHHCRGRAGSASDPDGRERNQRPGLEGAGQLISLAVVKSWKRMMATE